jgi:outer membrane biosynthesis protein TonB
LLKNVTEPRLIIELKVDKSSRLTYAQLVNSSGSLALDRLIQEWLLSSEFSLPPIKPDILYPFLIVVRR